jgi:hypothetical protein
MANAVDARIDPDERPLVESLFNPTRGNPPRKELPSRDIPVLSPGDLGSNTVWTTHTVV